MRRLKKIQNTSLPNGGFFMVMNPMGSRSVKNITKKKEIQANCVWGIAGIAIETRWFKEVKQIDDFGS